MRGNLLEEMLLIQEPSIFKLYQEMMNIAGYFVAPVFTIALLLEYFGELNFGGVVKKLLLITVFMGAFYQFHTKAVEISLESASYTLKKVSPRNIFAKKWFEVKVRTKENKSWNSLQSFVIPNLNDLLGTAFFLLAKVFIWLLKLIYSTAYHLNYVFSGLAAVLYFLGWTRDAIKGTIQTSIWCILMPFVVVAILALVGNSFDESALNGEVVGAGVDNIIWLFGVTLLLLASPIITFGMVKGEGIHSAGSKMGSMLISSGMKAAAAVPVVAGMSQYMAGKSTSAMRSIMRTGANSNRASSSNLKNSKSQSELRAGNNNSSDSRIVQNSKDQSSNKIEQAKNGKETAAHQGKQDRVYSQKIDQNKSSGSTLQSHSMLKSQGSSPVVPNEKTTNKRIESKNALHSMNKSTSALKSSPMIRDYKTNSMITTENKKNYRPVRRRPNELR